MTLNVRSSDNSEGPILTGPPAPQTLQMEALIRTPLGCQEGTLTITSGLVTPMVMARKLSTVVSGADLARLGLCSPHHVVWLQSGLTPPLWGSSGPDTGLSGSPAPGAGLQSNPCETCGTRTPTCPGGGHKEPLKGQGDQGAPEEIRSGGRLWSPGSESCF